MAGDRVSKLREYLAKPIVDEPGVIYLLCEVRKLLETNEPDSTRFALRMFCHWALHVDLDRPETTGEFLRRVDNFVTNNVSDFEGNGRSILDEDALFRDFVFLESFRNQLRQFLSSHDLASVICDRDDRWFEFLAAYSSIIEDGTLAIKGNKSSLLAAVEIVTFNKGAELTTDHHLPFTILWDIALRDGRVLRAQVEAMPALKMRSHKLSLIPAKDDPKVVP
jgi:hypothetical protein